MDSYLIHAEFYQTSEGMQEHFQFSKNGINFEIWEDQKGNIKHRKILNPSGMQVFSNDIPESIKKLFNSILKEY